MQLHLIFCLIATILGTSTAFNELRPSFIENDVAYYVSEVATMPTQFKAQIKQAVLQESTTSIFSTVKNGSIAFTQTVTSKSSASSTQNIQTETMTAGMSYLYSDNNDETYFVNITLNAENFPVLIDTGSPYLWIYSSNCTDASCKGKELFDGSNAEQVGGHFSLSYDSGVASGTIFEDSIIIGGYQTNNFEFGVADTVPSLFQAYDFSGVLGLPADNTSTTGLVNIVSFLAENGIIDSSKFTICIGDYSSDSTNSGILFFGSTKESLHLGDVYTSSIITESNHWEFKVDSVYVDDYQISFGKISIEHESTNTSRIGLLDSGTTSLVLPLDDANTLHSFFTDALTDGENYAILCDSELTFEFQISGKNWSLTPDMYIGDEYSTDSDLNGYCVSNIQGSNSTDAGTWILGILFMENKYVEFDYENQKIGLAERNNNIKFVNPSSNSSTTQLTITSSTLTTSSTRISSATSAPIAATTTTHSNIAFKTNHIPNNYWSLLIFSLLSIANFY